METWFSKHVVKPAYEACDREDAPSCPLRLFEQFEPKKELALLVSGSHGSAARSRITAGAVLRACAGKDAMLQATLCVAKHDLQCSLPERAMRDVDGWRSYLQQLASNPHTNHRCEQGFAGVAYAHGVIRSPESYK